MFVLADSIRENKLKRKPNNIEVKILHHDGRIEYRSVTPWDVYINGLDLKTLKHDDDEKILVFDYIDHPKNKKGSWFGKRCKFIIPMWLASQNEEFDEPAVKGCSHNENPDTAVPTHCRLDLCPINKGVKSE